MQEAKIVQEMCKGSIKLTKIVVAGSTTYEVVDTFKYLGILTGPHVAKNWDETMKSIQKKIEKVYGIIKYRKGIITYRT